MALKELKESGVAGYNCGGLHKSRAGPDSVMNSGTREERDGSENILR